MIFQFSPHYSPALRQMVNLSFHLVVSNANVVLRKVMLLKRHREENRSSRNVVYQTNVKNLMGRKENQCKCIERGECSKITVENN